MIPNLEYIMYLLYQGNTKNWDRKSKKNKNSLPTAREDGSWQSLRLCRLLTEWQSAKVTAWMASIMACLCRLQFFANCLAVGKSRQSANPALPTAGNSSWQRDLFAECEKKQLANKIAVGKEPVSCSVCRKHYEHLYLQ